MLFSDSRQTKPLKKMKPGPAHRAKTDSSGEARSLVLNGLSYSQFVNGSVEAGNPVNFTRSRSRKCCAQHPVPLQSGSLSGSARLGHNLPNDLHVL
jgi:hypothetical protein